MTTSIIIPTYNGKHKIKNLLDCLTNQSIKPFEVIVVNDGSTDGTLSFLKEYKSNLNLKLHDQPNSGRSVVRNKGAELSSGELLIFVDDDMRPESDFVAAHQEHHANNPRTILTGAQIDDLSKAKSDFQVYKHFLSLSWVSKLASKQNKPEEFSELYITAANFSIEKKIFIQLGGFNEKLRDCEDYEFALRSFKEGIPIYYSDKAFAWHDDFPSPRSFIKRQLEYKKFNEYLLREDAFSFAHLKDSRLQKPSLLKKMFFRFFHKRFWLDALERETLVAFPKPIRFKIYSWIITAHSTYKEHL